MGERKAVSRRWLLAGSSGKRFLEQRAVAGHKKDGCGERQNTASTTLHAMLWPRMPAGERIAAWVTWNLFLFA